MNGAGPAGLAGVAGVAGLVFAAGLAGVAGLVFAAGLAGVAGLVLLAKVAGLAELAGGLKRLMSSPRAGSCVPPLRPCCWALARSAAVCLELLGDPEFEDPPEELELLAAAALV